MIVYDNHKQYRALWARSSLRARSARERRDFETRIARLREQVDQIDLFHETGPSILLDVNGPGGSKGNHHKKSPIKSGT